MVKGKKNRFFLNFCLNLNCFRIILLQEEIFNVKSLRKGRIMSARQTIRETDNGSWIWLPDTDRKDNRRVFFRKEFVLPPATDFYQLQISALPFYHVYLNGEHVGYGPSAATHTKCYVDSYDVTQYLTPGINTLGLVVMDRVQRSWHTLCATSRAAIPVWTKW